MKLKLDLPLIALLVALPIVLFAIVILTLYLGEQKRSQQAALLHSSEIATRVIEDLVAIQLHGLGMLASSPALDGPDIGDFRERAARALRAQPHWINLLLTDRTRRILDIRASSSGDREAVLDPEGVEQVFETGKPHVSDIITGVPWTDGPVLILHVPVERQGVVRFTMGAVLPASVLAEMLSTQTSERDWRISVFDRAGNRVADTARNGLGALPGGAFAVDSGGGESAVVRSKTTGWTVVATTPGASRLGPFEWPLVIVVGGGLLAVCLAVVLAAMFLRVHRRGAEAELRLARLSTEHAVEMRLGSVAANLPGIVYRRILYPDGRLDYPFVRLGRGLSGDIVTAVAEAGSVLSALTTHITPSSAQVWNAGIRRSAAALDPFDVEFEVIVADRSYWLRSLATPYREADGSVVWDGVVLDVTAQRNAEASLRLGEERHRLAIEAAELGTFDWDLLTDNLVWSDRTKALFGLPPSASVSRPIFRSLIHADDQATVKQAMDRALDPHGPGLYDALYRVARPDGMVRWLSAWGRVLYDEHGPDRLPIRIIGVVADKTDAIEAEEAVRNARDMAERASIAKSKFLAAASHDLRQPVQSLLLLLPALGDHIRERQGRMLLTTARQAAEAMQSLLDTLLDISRLDAGIIRPDVSEFPLAQVLDPLAIYKPVAAQKGIEFKIVKSSAVVRSDPALLAQMLRNLTENAVKYTEAGRILIRCESDEGAVRIKVQDTGIGILREDIKRIWDEFYQVGNLERDRSQGLGLGLAIVRRLAHMLGHPIQVDSEPGRGSTFTISVPFVGAGAYKPEERIRPLSAGREGGCLVALVEDDVLVRTGVEMTLRNWGYDVTAAGSKDDLLALLRRNGRRPDVILADYRLRGETGLDVIRAIRDSFGGNIAAIVVTGETGVETLAAIQRSGLAVISKPVTPDRLRRGLAECLPLVEA